MMTPETRYRLHSFSIKNISYKAFLFSRDNMRPCRQEITFVWIGDKEKENKEQCMHFQQDNLKFGIF